MASLPFKDFAAQLILSDVSEKIDRLAQMMFDLYGNEGLTLVFYNRHTGTRFMKNYGVKPTYFDRYANGKGELSIRTGQPAHMALSNESDAELLPSDVCWPGNAMNDDWIVNASGFKDWRDDAALAAGLLAYIEAGQTEFRPEVSDLQDANVDFMDGSTYNP